MISKEPSPSSSSSSSSNSIQPPPTIPRNNDFDQITAKRLLVHCATLIVQDFPPGSEFGIDLSIHYTGDRFLGLKMIPPGLHFVYFSLVQAGSVSPRCGFYHYFNSGEILVTKWDAQAEDIVILDEARDQEQIGRLKDSFHKNQLDTHLGAYQFDQYQNWVSLTDCISHALFEKLNPQCGRIFSASALVYKPNSDGSVTAKLDQQGLPEMIVAPETAVRYVCNPLPKHFLYPAEATAKEITTHSLDSTYTLNSILNLNPDQSDNGHWLLGELQFAFTTFLVGHVWDSFEHWRDLMRIFTSARMALSNQPELFLAFIRVVHFQLKQTNEAIFADIVENENLVYSFLRTFVLNLRTASEHGVSLDLRNRGEAFARNLQKTLKWNFDDEPDDELPIIVQLD